MSDFWLPWATHKPIPPGDNDPRIKPVMFVAHRSASRGKTLYPWFNGPSGGVEAHGYTDRTGHSEQYRAFDFEADAQSAGNSWIVNGVRLGAISWETEGTADDDWTDAQVAELRRIITRVHDTLGIPLKIVASPQPTSLRHGGIGWHSEFPSWNTASHNCPGAANVRKLRHLIEDLNTPAPVPDPKELLTMELSDKITIPASYASNTTDDNTDEVITVETLLRRLHDWAYRAAFEATVANGTTPDQVADELAARLQD